MDHVRSRSSSTGDRVVDFEALYRRYCGQVFAYALRRTSRETASDVVADTFLVAWRRLDDVPAEALIWLLAVARKTLANHLRSAERRRALAGKLAEASSVPAPAADYPTTDGSVVMKAFARIHKKDQEAIALVAWEGLTPRQAAVVVGCSSVAFRARLHRAKRRLETELARGERSAGARALEPSDRTD
ncbi:MAG: RNA polymerase sigma factor [Actinobacteria bacterium]|nr:RNA polymerase sigma factor [Actinomycetota bacterium]